MATSDEIQDVKDMLGPDAAAEGWDDARIDSELDAGRRPNLIARDFWENRMAKTSTLANVSESGSSRQLSQLFTNAQSLAAYYRGAAAADDPKNQPSATCRPIRRV